MNEAVTIVDYTPELAPYFKALNLAWIQKYFAVEQKDEEVLSHPQEHILDKGGAIYFAQYKGEIAGTFALMKETEGVYELSKMAVDEKFHGLKIGHSLLQAAIEKGKALGASKLILYSNTVLSPAIHLYNKFGFKEVPLEAALYKRSNIKMELLLTTSRLQQLFQNKKEKILNVYCTAGYPQLSSTLTIMQALQDSGADIIELGIPYSDPLADGPVIQASGSKALDNGMTIARLFEQLKDFRKTIKLPVVLMGYLNPVLQYGFERFCAAATEVGIDGLILPDLPMHEYETEYGAIIKKYGLDFVFLITPETSETRIRKLDNLSSGFLYAVSSSSTTGGNKEVAFAESYLKSLHSMKLKNPLLVGFGIKDKTSFEAACRYADGAIIGSAYIKSLEGADDVQVATRKFLKSILK